jgi:hypothetical protein
MALALPPRPRHVRLRRVRVGIVGRGVLIVAYKQDERPTTWTLVGAHPPRAEWDQPLRIRRRGRTGARSPLTRYSEQEEEKYFA